jgi:hypothetical protein
MPPPRPRASRSNRNGTTMPPKKVSRASGEVVFAATCRPVGAEHGDGEPVLGVSRELGRVAAPAPGVPFARPPEPAVLPEAHGQRGRDRQRQGDGASAEKR